ncbi:putative transmembrane protein [Mycena venus]|uniref:Putative transmembrane protein n=1 Tax=Mycena venus TaxID=2733690 RepID=A0A8H7CXD7_9AGAR|nr:putative transmembrane protein [Mycena venus]
MSYDSAFTGAAATSASILLYHALQKLYTAQRQRAWIITGFASALMTLCSAPFVLDLVWSRGDVRALHPRFHFAALTCRAFQGTLLADLIVGCRYYRSSVTICWGWIHHITYILLIQFVIQRQWAHIFCLALLMELPTSHLSLSFLHPRFRHDWLFCASFLVTRIIFHLFLFRAFCSPRGLATVQGSYLPALFLAVAFPGHVVWFIQSVRGAIRRGSQRRASISQVEKQQPDRTFCLDQTLVSATLASLDDASHGQWNHGNRVDVLLNAM